MPKKTIKPPDWKVVDRPWKPRRLHLEDGPTKSTRGPLRTPVGDEWNLAPCHFCLRSIARP